MSNGVPNEFHQPFRPRARVLQLLGDGLIGSPKLAVFELVKNAYDADANEVIVRLDLATTPEPMITVADDGEGVTLDRLRSVWLVNGLRTLRIFSFMQPWLGSPRIRPVSTSCSGSMP